MALGSDPREWYSAAYGDIGGGYKKAGQQLVSDPLMQAMMRRYATPQDNTLTNALAGRAYRTQAAAALAPMRRQLAAAGVANSGVAASDPMMTNIAQQGANMQAQLTSNEQAQNAQNMFMANEAKQNFLNARAQAVREANAQRIGLAEGYGAYNNQRYLGTLGRSFGQQMGGALASGIGGGLGNAAGAGLGSYFFGG